MATNIFGRTNSELEGAFTSDGGILTFNAVGLDGDGQDILTGLVVQNFNMGFSQQVTLLYDLTSTQSYMVGGRARGRVAISHVVGPGAIIKAFYTVFGNVCRAKNTSINFGLGSSYCTDADNNEARKEQVSFVVKHPVIQDMGMSMDVNSMIVNENVQMLTPSISFVDEV